MRSYNFRKKFEDRNTGLSIAAVHQYIKTHSEQGVLFDIKKLLTVVRQNLLQYYKFDKEKTELYKGKQADIRASEIYSMYLHSLVYHLVHNVTGINKVFSGKVIDEILTDPFFVFTSNFDKTPEVVLWFDEETYCTALIQLSRENYSQQLIDYLKILSNQDRLQDPLIEKYFLNVDKRGKSALMYSAESGHDGICKILLEFVITKFGLDTLEAFLELKDNGGHTALQLATAREKAKVAEVILTYHNRLKLKNNIELSPAHQLFGGRINNTSLESDNKKARFVE